MVIDNLLGLKSSLALGIFFCKGKDTKEKFKENPSSKIFGIINGLTSNPHAHQLPKICKAFLCILQFYPKTTGRGDTKY